MSELMLLSNPRRRKRRHKASSHRKRRRKVARAVALSNPRRRKRHRHIMRNPRRRRAKRLMPSIGNVRSMVNNVVRPAMIAAGGAVALDMAWGRLPIPAALKTGPAQYLAKGAGAIALGMLAERVTSKSNAHLLAVGAMTVILRDAYRMLLGKFVPTLNLGAYTWEQYNNMGYYNPGQMAAYTTGSPIPVGDERFVGVPDAITSCQQASAVDMGAYDYTSSQYYG